MKLSAPIYHLKRQAKIMARQETIPLHRALDSIAKREGFISWSLLVSKSQDNTQVEKLAQSLRPSEMVLLGGRPGHGKTTVGLEIMFSKLKAGNDAYFFTLEYNSDEVKTRFVGKEHRDEKAGAKLIVDTSDEICADYIIENMCGARSGSVAVIDYLQLLDQKRSTPELDIQLTQLHKFAHNQDVTLILISQIDRSFDQSGRDFPQLDDVRLPNPIDLQLFNRLCFVHDNQLRWKKAA